MPPICESALVEQLKLKNEKAFSYVYSNYAAALLGTIVRKVKCQLASEELLHNVFLKIWNHIELYTPEKSSLYTWMHAVARNEAIDYIRSKGAKNKRLTSCVVPMEINDAFSEITTLRRDLIKSLSLLTHSERIIIDLFYTGFTCKEIGALRQMPEGSVKTKMRCAFKKLKVILS